MISTHVRSLDASVHKTAEWLSRLTEVGGFETPQQAYSAIHAVLHSLRDVLTVDEAAHLGAQMPIVIRGIFYEGWKPAALPVPARSLGDFLDRVRDRLGNSWVNPEHACRAVFTLLQEKISSGEIDDVRHMLHEDVRTLWTLPRVLIVGE